jgi:hypothetical protein
MIQKYQLMFPNETSVFLTRKDKTAKEDGKTQLGGYAGVKANMLDILNTVFDGVEVKEYWPTKNKVIFIFKTKPKVFQAAVERIAELDVIVTPIAKVGRCIR